MSATQDAKLSKIRTALAVTTGDIGQLEADYIASLNAGVTQATVKDMWHQYWDLIAVAAGNSNDRANTWLGGLGHTGSLQDRWNSYWNS